MERGGTLERRPNCEIRKNNLPAGGVSVIVSDGVTPLAVQRRDMVNTAEEISRPVADSEQDAPTAAVISIKALDHEDTQKQVASWQPRLSGLLSPPRMAF
jgi:hypothetical protein